VLGHGDAPVRERRAAEIGERDAQLAMPRSAQRARDPSRGRELRAMALAVI